jgi:hypothetical protein
LLILVVVHDKLSKLRWPLLACGSTGQPTTAAMRDLVGNEALQVTHALLETLERPVRGLVVLRNSCSFVSHIAYAMPCPGKLASEIAHPLLETEHSPILQLAKLEQREVSTAHLSKPHLGGNHCVRVLGCTVRERFLKSIHTIY